MLSPEPILDVMRGLSTIASFSIVLSQYWVLTQEIFTNDCEMCKGTGKVTCRHCGGTKTLRRRPGELRANRLDIVDRTKKDTYMCIYCGPPAPSDFKLVQDTDREAYAIMDNFKAAIAGKNVPVRFSCRAGCMPCPACNNNPVIRRHTPNWERLALLEMPFDVKVTQRRGYLTQLGERDPRRRYHEFPSIPPHNEELDGIAQGERILENTRIKKERKRRKKALEKEEKNKDDKSEKFVRPQDVFRPEDYIYPYVDDDDTDDE